MPSLADVAARAGVSKTTASRVLNGLARRYRITDATVAVVEEASRCLGYRPSYMARALTRGRTDNIGLLAGSGAAMGSAQLLYFGSVLAGVNAVVRPAGYHVVLAAENRRYETLGFDGNPADRVDALIGFGFVLGPAFTLVDLERMPTPLVIVGPAIRPTRRPVVEMDPAPGLREAVAHLASLGHRSIAWIGQAVRHESTTPPVNAGLDAERARIIAEAARDLGLTFLVASLALSSEPNLLPRDQALTMIREAARTALPGILGATAYLCWNDYTAMGVQRWLAERGLQVPQDRSLIGFDNLVADLNDPPLTTVDHRLADLGQRAGDLALEMARDPSAVERLAGQVQQIPSRLVIRGSTGPAPSA